MSQRINDADSFDVGLSYFEFGAVCRVPAFFVQRPFLSLCKESEQAEWFEMVLFVLKLEEICRKEA